MTLVGCSLLDCPPADMPPQAWKALALCAGKMVEMFRPIAFVENKDTDTQVSAAHAAAAVVFFDARCAWRSQELRLPASTRRVLASLCG